MKYVVAFACLSVMCMLEAVALESMLARLLWGSLCVAFAGVALAYGRTGAVTFLKSKEGVISPLSYALFWPYHLLNAVSLLLFRWFGRENAYDQITPNLYLGSCLGRLDARRIVESGVTGVLDLTCEFSEARLLRQSGAYRCLPLLDTQAPSLEQLQDAVLWLEEQRGQGPVYVHCALGHGRSATVMAACLLHCGEVTTVEGAVAHLAALRPKIGLSEMQIQLLRQFHHRKGDMQ